MNKRELVIITVVVNVAILALLFMTAHHIDQPVAISVEEQTAANTPYIAASTLPTPAGSAPIVKEELSLDEVDNVLRDFAANYAAPRDVAPAGGGAASAAAPAAPPTAAARGGSGAAEAVFGEVVVKRGDFLEKIARQNNTTVDALKKLNSLTSDNLKVGQILRVPPAQQRRAVPPSPASVTEQAVTGDFYKLKTGDNPWKIAKQFNVSVEELLHLNNLNESSARSLKPGDTIRVR